MNLSFAGPGIAIVEDFYDERELKLIWKELDYLTKAGKLLPPEKTGTGRDEYGNPKKSNQGLFLEEYYKNKTFSNILNTNRKIWNVVDNKFLKSSLLFRYMFSCNEESTLLSYYEDGDYYKAHQDMSVYTVLSYFFKEPKKFTGGNLVLHDYDLSIEIKNNMVIYMPSILSHEVTPIVMEENAKGFGRYSVSQFLFVRNGTND